LAGNASNHVVHLLSPQKAQTCLNCSWQTCLACFLMVEATQPSQPPIPVLHWSYNSKMCLVVFP